MDGLKKNINIFRFIMIGWLTGWYIKIIFFHPYLSVQTFLYPIHNEIIPALFQDPGLSLAAFYFPVLTVPFIFLPTRMRLRFASIVYVVCSFILCIHNNTYNDATFVTSFWVGLWMMWFAWQMDRGDAPFILHARVLAQCLVGMVFLGGFIGKLTPEYYSGEAFYNIFLVKTGYPIYHWLGGRFSVEQLKIIAHAGALFVIMTEFFLALSPVLPSRLVFAAAPVIMASVMITNTWMIFSVMGCMIGLMLACLYSYKFYPQKNKF